MLTAKDTLGQKLKSRLITHFKESLAFPQPSVLTKPELVYSSAIALLNVINAASSLPGTETPIMQTTDPTVHHDANEMARMIYFVSKAIGNEIAHCEGINLQPLNVCGQIELFHCKISSSTKPILAVQTSLMRERSS